MKLCDIKSPKDIRNLEYSELENLAGEIREKIIDTVTESGGHLASNLGVVELTLALHRAFDTPNDKIIFDVGHQTYAHKLITGRYDKFETLRSHNGLSGFPRYNESEYDNFEVGHASTAISAALGMARSRDLKNENHNVVAIVGDGALTGGMCYEALNDAGLANTRLIVVLNDNEMSISKNVGALSTYLSNIRTSSGYRFAKDTVRKGAINIPIIGPLVHGILHFFKGFFKHILIRENFFSPLGFHYLGPIDGHDIKALETVLNKAKIYKAPVLIHCCTKKGYGYEKAESKPEKYHGVSPKNKTEKIENRKPIDAGNSAVLTLLDQMEKDKRIVVVTAAMSTGTSTYLIKEKYPDRYFDVGIAEEHALTMCAGLAKSGMKPYFFVYSTFFQRCYDQMMHDVYLQNLPVTLMLDRSGLSGQDGVTHHGIYDIALLNTMPNIKVFAPLNNDELNYFVKYSLNLNEPCVIRYPKILFALENTDKDNYIVGKWQKLLEGDSCTVISYGNLINEIIKAAEFLTQKGIHISLFNASTISPVDEPLLEQLSQKETKVIVIEEHIEKSGLGSTIALLKEKYNYKFKLKIKGIETNYIQHGNISELLNDAKLDYINITNIISDYISLGD